MSRFSDSVKFRKVIYFYIYIALTLFHVIRGASDEIISSHDLSGYFLAFQEISRGGSWSLVITPQEPILPFLYYLTSTFWTPENVFEMYLFHQVIFFSLVYLALRKLSHDPTALLIIMIFIDTTLLVHLFRQFLSSVFICLALQSFLSVGLRSVKTIIFAFLAVGIHQTAILFLPLAFVFSQIKYEHLRVILVASVCVSYLGVVAERADFLNYFYGIPILHKAYYSIVVMTGGAEGGLRLVSQAAVFFALFIRSNKSFVRVTIGFLSMSVLFSQIPILGIRVGLLGTGLLVGLIFFAAFQRIAKKIGLPMLNPSPHAR